MPTPIETAQRRIRDYRRSDVDLLDLSALGLTQLPSDLWDLTGLKRLFISHNRLTVLDPRIRHLRMLETLVAHNNQLRTLPPELGELQRLHTVDFSHNPLADTLSTLAARGAGPLRTFLSSLGGSRVQLFEAKMLLVGEGRVGKTSLLAALRGEPFVRDRDTTHGIELGTLRVVHPANSDAPIQLNTWDFGGQEVYRITHQFFYSRRSLYLLLWDTQMGVDQCNVTGWLTRIRIRVGLGARVIVVATYAKTGGRLPRINAPQLQDDFGDMIVGFREVDNATGYGIEALRRNIADASARLPQMGESYPTSWNLARTEIRNCGEPRMSFDSFLEISRSVGMGPQEAMTLAELMHDIGDIVFYGNDDGLRNEVVLKPEWLTKAIGFVLEDADTNQANGVLHHSRLDAIWNSHGVAGRERYPPRLHPYFVRLMEKYDVSYRLESQDASLIAQLVPVARPAAPWAPRPSDAIVTLVCQMDTLPPGFVPWLIVRTHQFAVRPPRHWQGGMYLEYGHHGMAVIETRGTDCYVHVRGAWPNYFISVLQYIISQMIHDRWPGLNAVFAAPCPRRGPSGDACSGRFPLTVLHEIKRTNPGLPGIPCYRCAGVTDIDELLTGFRPPSVRVHLDAIERGVHGLASKIEASVAVLLRALAEESRDCPKLFTMTQVRTLQHSPKGPLYIRLRLTLWCERPGYQHPCCRIGSGGAGEYEFDRQRKWLRAVAPYVRIIAKTLKMLVPVWADSVKLAVGRSEYEGIEDVVSLMESSIEGLDSATEGIVDAEVDEGRDSSRARREVDGDAGTNAAGEAVLLPAEGAGLREFSALLGKIDPARSWGELRRVVSNAGEYLWVCPRHYREYDPGLPRLPKRAGRAARGR